MEITFSSKLEWKCQLLTLLLLKCRPGRYGVCVCVCVFVCECLYTLYYVLIQGMCEGSNAVVSCIELVHVATALCSVCYSLLTSTVTLDTDQ